MENTFDTGLGSSGRKTTILILIVLFHVGVIWALAESLNWIDAARAPTIIQAKIIEEVTKQEELPPPPPALETPPPYVQPPDFVVENPVPTQQTTALVATTSTKPAPPPVAHKEVKVAPSMNKRYLARFQPDYPPTSRRLGEEGSVILSVLVGVDGKVEDGKIQTSSGFPRLDEAALKHALRAWRFNPGTEDGKPVAMWHSIKVTFKITN
ncbi:MAG: energy transducer TonB [Gammaproteobacteria bacterium PRO9]|nr:energy transducer TonB [Gammaproteobacteria bacterium PRO9]